MRVYLQRLQNHPQHRAQLFQLLRTHLCYDAADPDPQQPAASSQQPAAAAAPARSSAAWLKSAQAAGSVPAAVLDGFSDSGSDESDDGDDSKGAAGSMTPASAKQKRRADALSSLVWGLFDALFAADSGAVLGLMRDSTTLQETAWAQNTGRGRPATRLAWQGAEGKHEGAQGLRCVAGSGHGGLLPRTVQPCAREWWHAAWQVLPTIQQLTAAPQSSKQSF